MSLLVTAEVVGQEIQIELFVVQDGSFTSFERVTRSLNALESSSSIYDSEIYALRFAGRVFHEHISVNHCEVRTPRHLAAFFVRQLRTILNIEEGWRFYNSFYSYISALMSE